MRYVRDTGSCYLLSLLRNIYNVGEFSEGTVYKDGTVYQSVVTREIDLTQDIQMCKNLPVGSFRWMSLTQLTQSILWQLAMG